MRILFMGTPEFAVPALEALVTAGHEVCGVFTQPDKPKNQGNEAAATPVKACAKRMTSRCTSRSSCGTVRRWS